MFVRLIMVVWFWMVATMVAGVFFHAPIIGIANTCAQAYRDAVAAHEMQTAIVKDAVSRHQLQHKAMRATFERMRADKKRLRQDLFNRIAQTEKVNEAVWQMRRLTQQIEYLTKDIDQMGEALE